MPGGMGARATGIPASQYGDPYGDPYGASPASQYGDPYAAQPAPQGFSGGAPQQPRFSAGSLIDDDGLPQWLSAPDGGAPGGWGAQAPMAPEPAVGQQWQQRPAPQQPDIASQHTIRQPSVGGGGQMPPQYPFAQAPQPPAYPPQPAQPSYPAPQPSYPQPGYGPPPQPGYAPAPQPGYPQPGYAQPSYPQPSYPAPQPSYPQPGYAQPPAPMNYGGNPAYQQPPSPQPLAPQPNINAFPSIDQAGTGYRGQQPQPQWGAGRQGGVVAPRAPVPSGMQARSLVDDRALPKWLRDQPESAGASNMAEWIGASAAQEQMPPFLSEAYAQAPSAQAQPPYAAAPSFGDAQPFGGRNDQADWQRAQANGSQAMQEPAPPGVGFAASDLIDPNSLPDWVTQRAPAPQTFSSTHGWSAAPDLETVRSPAPSYAASEDYGEGTGAQAVGANMDWGDASWDNGAQDTGVHGDYDAQSQSPRGRPLAPDELPPWLQGKGGAPGPAAHNPWMAPSQPEAASEVWDDGDGWDDQSGQHEASWQGASGWGEHRDDRHDDRRGADWDYGDSQAGWNDQRSAARWEDSERYSAPYAAERYDQPARGGRGRYDDWDSDDRYDQESMDYDEREDASERRRGRGFLGFLRRGNR